MNARDASIVAETRAWVRRAVIGLNLCPFAKAPEAKGRVRYVACDATEPEALIDALAAELRLLTGSDDGLVETTLLIHPFVLTDFLDFNDFTGIADDFVARSGYEGVVQLVPFHPQFRFAGTDPDDIDNATNRSPYPTMQLLRESSVDRAVEAFPDPEAIFEVNIATMRSLGRDGWTALQDACRAEAASATEDAG